MSCWSSGVITSISIYVDKNLPVLTCNIHVISVKLQGHLTKVKFDYCWQEVPGMGFHITQPGSSVATSLIDGESKPKHVLLLEIKVMLFWLQRNIFCNSLDSSPLLPVFVLMRMLWQGNQYRPTKIPLTSVRPFEYTEVTWWSSPSHPSCNFCCNIYLNGHCRFS